ncbi:hypothetical protein [uncultured Roseobacter sp.]|uniref:hypothetical protein n=1 Tax=uncultured Roseobacter sp. TaxID=114847 RepID=UPI00260F9FB4|nr:hypothetical protein [uncultured Roseobacter sp.]
MPPVVDRTVAVVRKAERVAFCSFANVSAEAWFHRKCIKSVWTDAGISKDWYRADAINNGIRLAEKNSTGIPLISIGHFEYVNFAIRLMRTAANLYLSATVESLPGL